MEREISNPKGAYTKLLSESLKTFVHSQMEKPPETQVEVFEELALVRHSAAGVVEMYSKACEKLEEVKNNPDSSKEEKAAAAEFRFAAAAMLQKELFAVTNIAKTASSIQSAATNQLSLSAMEGIVNTIIEIIFESLRMEKNGLAIAARIEQKINSQVNLSVDRGTVKLPSDDLVSLMDKSIPMSAGEIECET